ncbi:MAG TPA: protein-glutamate O-methyltransferase CheR [Micavibrio sp.]
MRISDFELYRDLLYRHSGLSLTADKSYLLDSRLTPVARRWGYPTLDGMTLSLRGVPENKLVEAIIEAMINDETCFFRDIECFFVLRDAVIPFLMKTRGKNKKLRIWCAGCSSGQEAYSVAMILKDMELQLKNWKIEILGSDLSGQAIRKARAGDYTQFEVQRGLPVQRLMQHFDEVGDFWRLHDDIRNLVRFEQFNLLEPMDDLGLFDLILCRNVMASFESETRTSILSRMAGQMAEDGILLLGSGETLNGIKTPFKPLDSRPGFFGLEKADYALTAPKQAAC